MFKRCAAALGLFATLAAVHATQFSIQIGQFDKASQKITDSSLMFEDIVLEYFFDAGYVVSNSPSVLTDSPDEAPVLAAISDAHKGSLDYLASIVLVYDRDAQKAAPDNPQHGLVQANWKLYRVADGRVFSSGETRFSDFYPQKPPRDARKAALLALKNFAFSLSRDVDSALQGS